MTVPNLLSLGRMALVPLFVIGTDRIATVHSRLAFQCAQYLPLKILPPFFNRYGGWNTLDKRAFDQQRQKASIKSRF